MLKFNWFIDVLATLEMTGTEFLKINRIKILTLPQERTHWNYYVDKI
jgi:hypothetical protein